MTAHRLIEKDCCAGRARPIPHSHLIVTSGEAEALNLAMKPGKPLVLGRIGCAIA